MTDVYKSALEQAERELAEAILKRDEWTLEVARLQDLVKSLKAARPSRASDDADSVGFQEVVLSAVGMALQPVGAMEVRDYIQSVGYDLRKYANPLAVIHGALKRLKERGELVELGGKYQRMRRLSDLGAVADAGATKVASAFRRRNIYGIGQQADDLPETIKRARTAPGSMATQRFAEEDAKKKK